MMEADLKINYGLGHPEMLYTEMINVAASEYMAT